MAADEMEDEELRFCFNIDVTEDEFYQNNEVKQADIGYFSGTPFLWTQELFISR